MKKFRFNGKNYRVRWDRIAGSLGVGVLFFGMGAWALQIATDPMNYLPPCPTEDSANCKWVAEDHGNGEGRSFYDLDGEITYVD